MRLLVDTSSLVYMAKYYVPLDTEGELVAAFKEKMEAGKILIIDEVLNEARNVSGGIAIERLSFLKDRDYLSQCGLPIDTKSLTPVQPQKFNRRVDDHFAVQMKKRDLELKGQIYYSIAKNDFLKNADGLQIIYAYNNIKSKGERLILVTEESETDNDSKPFKKLPAICKLIDLEHRSLPEILTECSEFEFQLVSGSDK